MRVYEIDPLADSRWPEFLERHPLASVFHSQNWLRALKLTYRYEPVAYTTAAPDFPIKSAWVFCRVKSWLTGRRLVSLPFSDHCDPLVGDGTELNQFAEYLMRERKKNQWRYIECRIAEPENIPKHFGNHEQFCFHVLSLEPDLDRLFHNLHKSSTQRKIRRAEREELTYKEGSSQELLDSFYRLLVQTRRRHRVPPQPRKWFSNLLTCFGNQLKLRVAFHNKTPIASILTLRFKNSLVYKYGGADERSFPFGGMQMLFWRAIEDAKKEGLCKFDLGRSGLEREGLIVMKDRLGAKRSSLSYFRNPAPKQTYAMAVDRLRSRKHLFACVPNRIAALGGRLLYRHFG